VIGEGGSHQAPRLAEASCSKELALLVFSPIVVVILTVTATVQWLAPQHQKKLYTTKIFAAPRQDPSVWISRPFDYCKKILSYEMVGRRFNSVAYTVRMHAWFASRVATFSHLHFCK
jgi:hypothetical protein